MKRRNFIKTSAALGFYPVVASGLPMGGLQMTSPLMLNPCNVTDRSMVIIFLSGGNDIFNTTVPLNQFSDYANYRPTTHLLQNQLITLDSTLPTAQQIGLHPNLTDFKSLYDAGNLKVIQGVGYDSPNKSHFKSLENWLTGSGGSIVNQTTGWAGRFLKDRYPGYNGNPFIGELDPLGILFGNMNKTGFHTAEQHSYEINLSGQDPSGFYSLISSLSGAPIANIPSTEHGGKLAYLAAVENSVNVYAQRISNTFNNGSNSSVVYPNSDLGNQLKSIAKMLSGGSRTKLFMATTGGFDNHVNLVDGANSSTGLHANLMTNMGSSIKAFQDDLVNLGLDSNVVTVVFSEFGRKIIENGSLGIDHGTLSSMFVIGTGVEGGAEGDNIILTDQDSQGAPNPLQIQNDYRTVFATLMQDWLGADNSSLQNTFLSPSLYSNKLNLINQTNIVPASCYFTPQPPIVCACLHVKTWLEGYYDPAAGEMHTDLLTNNLLPLNQPFNIAPFNYQGTESVTTFPADTTDWLLIQLRDSDDISVVIDTKAVLIKKDGTLMGTDGSPGVLFPGIPDGAYHLAIFHRSHLAILSSSTIITDAPSTFYDFSISDTQALGESQLKEIAGAYCMIVGEIVHDNNINNLDFDTWKQNDGSVSVYHNADLDGNGDVNAADESLWIANRSKLGNL